MVSQYLYYQDRKSADVEHLLSINSAPKEQVTILENDPFDPNQIPTQFVIHENEEEDLSEPEDQVVTVKEKEQSECNVAMITLQQQEEFKILLAGLGQYHKYLDGKDPVVEYQQAVNTIDKDRFYHLTPDFINKEQKRLIADFQQVFKYSTLPDKTYPLDLSKGAIESIVASKQSKERLKKLELDCEFNPPMLCYSTASVINWQNPAMQREMVSACRANKNIPEHCSFDDIVASHTAPTHVLETVLNHGQCYQDAQQNKLIKFFLEGTYKQGSAKPASIVMEAFFTSDCHGHIGLFHYFANPHKGTLDYAKKNDQRLPDHQTQGFVGKLNLTDDHTLCWDVVKKKASGTICITSQDALQAYVFPLKKK